MGLELPAPRESFEVVLDDGARIKVRRHGNAEGVRLFLSHGNGYAIDGYLPFWEHFLADFDVILFDFRNHGENTPVTPANHTYAQLARDLERVYADVTAKLGTRKSAGVFHSMSGRTAMKHALEIGFRWDALVLFDPPNVPPPGHPAYAGMEAFAGEAIMAEWRRDVRNKAVLANKAVAEIEKHRPLGSRLCQVP